MTQKELKLLIQDISPRAQYGVKLQCIYHPDRICTCIGVDNLDTDIPMAMCVWEKSKVALPIDVTKPYLRPVSSMTDEECAELFKILSINEDNPSEWLKINDIEIITLFTKEGKDLENIAEAIEYLYSIHVDFRGLIDVGLALEALKDMYSIK